jgi:hypothetical protein
LKRVFDASSGADRTQTVFGWLSGEWKATGKNIL